MIMKELVIREYVMFKFSIKVRIEIIVNENTKKKWQHIKHSIFIYSSKADNTNLFLLKI